MVHNYLDGIETVRLWEPDYVVHCDCRKGAHVLGVWYGYGGGFHEMCVDFVGLAAGASVDEFLYKCPHFRPDLVLLDWFNVLCLPWVSHDYGVVV